MSKDVVDQLSLALRRWNFLTRIPQPKGDSPSTLAKQLGRKNQEISRWCKELEKVGLITLQPAEGGRFKLCQLTKKGATVIEHVKGLLEMLEQAAVTLVEPRPLYWTDLEVKLHSGSEFVVKAAFKDLQAMCRSTQVWMLGEEFWNFLRDELDDDNPNLDKIIECVSITQANAADQSLEEIVLSINRRFSERFKNMVLRGRNDVRSDAMTCLKIMLSDEDLLTFTKEGFAEALKLEDQEEYHQQYSVLAETFKKLYEKHGEDLRKWLYEHMENADALAAKRSYELYNIIQG